MTSTVIRGDNPHAAGLANVWLELRKTLNTLADPASRPRRTRIAVRPPAAPGTTDPTDPTEPAEGSEGPGPGAAAS